MNINHESSNIALYTIGSLISHFGSAIYAFAIGLYVLKITGSSLSFATTLAFGVIPVILLSPFAGVIVDRFNRKKIIISMDLANGALFLGLFVFMQAYSLNLWTIYLTTFLSNVFVTFFGICFIAVKPQLVSKEKLTTLNSISQIITASSGLLAPMLGGLVFAFIDIKLFILLNGVSFIISTICEMFIDYKYNTQRSESESKGTLTARSVLQSLKEGLDYLRGKPILIGIIQIFVVFNIIYAMGIQVPLPYILNNILSVSSETYGLINSMLPLGLVLGAALVGKITKKIAFRKLLYTLTIVAATIVTLAGSATIFPAINQTTMTITIFYGSLMGIIGCTLTLIDVPLMTFLQTETDENYLGRVFSIVLTIAKAVNPIAYIVAGLIVEQINPFLMPIIMGLIGMVIFYNLRGVLLQQTRHIA